MGACRPPLTWRLCWAGPYLQVWGGRFLCGSSGPATGSVWSQPRVPVKTQDGLCLLRSSGRGGHLGLQLVPDCPLPFFAELGRPVSGRVTQQVFPTPLLLSVPYTLTPTLDPQEPDCTECCPQAGNGVCTGWGWARVGRDSEERDSGSFPASDRPVGWTPWVLWGAFGVGVCTWNIAAYALPALPPAVSGAPLPSCAWPDQRGWRCEGPALSCHQGPRGGRGRPAAT